MPSPYGSLVQRLDRDAASPWLTQVDLVTGGRTELSVASAVNGMAKAAHLVGSLAEGLGRSAVVDIRLPLHWQTVTLLLGCWGAGAVTSLAGPANTMSEVDAVVLGPDDPGPVDTADAVWASRLHPLGLPFETAPAFPVEDLALLLRGQPDAPPAERIGLDPAVVLAGGTVDLEARANELASKAGPAARVLTALPLDTVDGLVAAAVLPTTEARSVVLVLGAAEHPDSLPGLAATERVTATMGLVVPGLVRLD